MTLIYFILILGLIVFIHELGHFIQAKKAGVYCYEFSLGMGPKLYSFKRKNDETTYSLRLLPIGGFVQMAGEEVEVDEDVPKNKRMQSKTAWQRFKIVIAGALNNFILGIVLLFLMALIYGSPETKPYIKDADEKYNAYKVNVRSGDLVLKINGKKVKTIDDALLRFELTKDGDPIKFTLKSSDGVIKEVTVRPTKIINEDKTESYVYGISFDNSINKGFFKAIKYSFVKFASIYRSMVNVIGNLIVGKLGINSLSGPVGIYNVIGEQSKMGFENVIYLCAFISINVGFVNLIPFPAFDGGRALFIIIEKIRKKPVDQKVENTIHSIGFILLMLLVVIITIQDIIKLF